jgi:uncharacterized protein YbjT (DUF2867 family)
MPLVEPFLAEAERVGVRRVVLLGSAIEFPNAPGMLRLAARVRDRHGSDHLLTGPRALSYHDAAAIITTRTGRPARVVDVGDEELVAHHRAAGLPTAFAESLAAVDAGVRSGRAEQVSTSVLDLTGLPPRTFDDFARRHAPEWTTPSPVGT